MDDREFKSNIDPSTFVQTPLDVVRKDPQSGERTLVKKVTAVKYQYRARALVNKSLANRSTFSMALLMGFYPSLVEEIIKDCVENYEHDQEFASSFWYVLRIKGLRHGTPAFLDGYPCKNHRRTSGVT